MPWPQPPPCPCSVPATWELYVEMRFTQLRTACDLELWAEAFRRCGHGWMGVKPGWAGMRCHVAERRGNARLAWFCKAHVM